MFARGFLEGVARRHTLFAATREENPRRWARHTRNWTPVSTVTLNPERDSVVNAVLQIEMKAAAA